MIDIEAINGIELLGEQSRNDAVPILGDEGAFGLHLDAERLGDIDVEAGQGAVGFQIVEGRVGAFRTDDDFFAIGHGGACHQRENGSGSGHGETSGNTHCDPLCWRTAGFLFLTAAGKPTVFAVGLARYSYALNGKINSKAVLP